MNSWKDDFWGIKEEIKLKLVGYKVTGTALINLWDGTQGTVDMTPHVIKQQKTPTKKQITGKINDGEYGCESIEEADVNVYAVYGSGYEEFINTYHFDKKDCKNAFRGIKSRSD